jgi:ABC-type Mn2+/Zn2+ transport system permease subunit
MDPLSFILDPVSPISLSSLTAPLHYDYMLRAILASALVGAVGGFLSCFITLRGWSLMGDALSHAVVPGVAIAHLLGWPFSVGAFVSGLLAAGVMPLIKRSTRLREDVVIGMVFTTFFALGLLLISLYPTRVDLKSIVFGNILSIANSDLWQLGAVALTTFIVLLLKWRDLMLVTFDAAQARAIGLPVQRLQILLMMLLSATAVAALQTVGAVLVVGVLVIPGATAYLLTDRFGRMIAVATGIGAVTGLAGAYGSWFFNGATGGCVITLQALLFVCVWMLAPKHGRLSHWLRLWRGGAAA